MVRTSIVSVLLFCAATAQAEPVDVVIRTVVVDSTPADAPVEGDKLRRMTSSALEFVQDVNPREVGATTRAQIAECGSDPECLSKALSPSGVQLCLLEVMNYDVFPASLALRLIDLEQRRVLHAVRATAEPQLDAIERVVGAEVRRVFEGAGFSSVGRLRVVADPADAEVKVDGKAASGNVFVLPPESYEVWVKKSGYKELRVPGVVVAGRETQLDLHLEERPSVLGAWWFWTSIGAAVVAGTVTAIVLAQPGDPTTARFCHGPDLSLCPGT